MVINRYSLQGGENRTKTVTNDQLGRQKDEKNTKWQAICSHGIVPVVCGGAALKRMQHGRTGK